MEVAVSTEKAPVQAPVGHIAPEGSEGNFCLMLARGRRFRAGFTCGSRIITSIS